MQNSEHATELGRQIAAIDAELSAKHQASAMSEMLAAAPGICPVNGITPAVGVDFMAFAS